MRRGGGGETVELEVPARVEYVRLVRMLVASLAASRRELDEDRLDDLRLAVSEACTLAVEAAEGVDGRLVVSCREEPDAFVVDLHDGPGERPLPKRGSDWATLAATDAEDSLPFELIRALVDDVDSVVEDGVRKLRLRLTCAPAAGPTD